jgi:transcriptional regulator with XRE-family HTH domain
LEKSFKDFQKDFGTNLKRLRKSKSVSADTLSVNAELSDKSFIHSIERGERDIQLSTVFKLAKGLGLEPKDLLNFNDVELNNEEN